MTHEELLEKMDSILKRMKEQAFMDLLLMGQTRPFGEYLSEDDKNKLKELVNKPDTDQGMNSLDYSPGSD